MFHISRTAPDSDWFTSPVKQGWNHESDLSLWMKANYPSYESPCKSLETTCRATIIAERMTRQHFPIFKIALVPAQERLEAALNIKYPCSS